jgi:hypothetical protein
MTRSNKLTIRRAEPNTIHFWRTTGDRHLTEGILNSIDHQPPVAAFASVLAGTVAAHDFIHSEGRAMEIIKYQV